MRACVTLASKQRRLCILKWCAPASFIFELIFQTYLLQFLSPNDESIHNARIEIIVDTSDNTHSKHHANVRRAALTVRRSHSNELGCVDGLEH